MYRLILISIAMLFALTACSASKGTSTRSEPAGEPATRVASGARIVIAKGQPIKVGVSVALSGAQSSIGQDLADAADLAIGDYGSIVRGHLVISSRQDDHCADAEQSVSVAHAFTGDPGIAGVIGPMCTTGAEAANSTYEEAETVHISPAVTRSELSNQGEKYFFRTAWRDDAQARVQANYAHSVLNANTVIVVDDGTPYAKALADAFSQAFEADGGATLSRERSEGQLSDVVALASSIGAANPDAVVFEGLNPQAPVLAKALRGQKYAGAFVAPDAVYSEQDFIRNAGSAAEGAVVTAGPRPDLAFVTHFRERFLRDPGTPFVLQMHDAVTVLLRAISNAASEQPDGSLAIDRDALERAVRSTEFTGLTGSVKFDERGDRSGDGASDVGLRIYRVMNGLFVPVP